MDTSVTSIVFATVFVIIVYLVLKWIGMPKNFPPGPLGIPMVGGMIYLTQFPSVGMMELAKTHGDVFSLKSLNRNIVFVNGFKALREALTTNGKTISGRWQHYLTRITKGKEPQGIVAAPRCCESWAASRKLYNSVVREPKGLDDIIELESRRLVAEIEAISPAGRPTNIHGLLSTAVLNILSHFVFGVRYDKDDVKMKTLIEINNKMFSSGSPFSRPSSFLPQLVPGLAHVWVPKHISVVIEAFELHTKFCVQEVAEHRKTINRKKPRDFIDHYLIAMEKEGIGRSYTEKGLVVTLVDLFQAGNETTTSGLRWAVLYLAGHQEVQEKVHEEIDCIIGPSKQAQYEDRQNMPYTQAVVYEVLRFANVAPHGLPRVAVTDVTLQGYNIPAGTTMFLNLHSSHMQEDKWKNAKQFDPENFLEDGVFRHHEAFMAFSGGVRGCVGKYQALQEIFLLMVGIIQKFRIMPESPDVELDYSPVPGMTFGCRPYKFSFIKRKF